MGIDAGDVTLRVNARGDALVGYTRSNGGKRTVLATGALNARPPSQDVPQVEFAVDYTGGWETRGRRVAFGFRKGCRPYDGPALAMFVIGCKAPDGSYWALQSWQRLQPMRGVAPFRPRHTAVELHLSHWTGPLPELEVSPNWTYGGRWQGLFGRLMYQGSPVHGFRTPSDRVTDAYGRFVYIDTFDSDLRARLEARHRHRDPHRERRLLLQLRPAGAAARATRPGRCAGLGTASGTG